MEKIDWSKRVMDIFLEICKVPRPSGHEEKICEYLKNFAQSRGLGFRKDSVGNVLITKPATPGFENRQTVIMQAHQDMVCEKDATLEHDFLTQPIETYVEDGWLKARGTTLGADDGMGIAMALAVMDSSEIQHGPLECLFTVSEETGLTGATELKPGFMSGKLLVNLDSEQEGEIFMGCAGGINTSVEFDYKTEPVPAGYFFLRVALDKFHGGHSGDDIEKGFRVDFNLFAAEIQEEYHVTERTPKFIMESTDPVAECIEQKVAANIIRSVAAVFNGVYAMSMDMPGLVETSSTLARIRTENGKVTMLASQRSSYESAKYAVQQALMSCFKLAGAKVESFDSYPGWAPNPNSELLKIAIRTYSELFGHEPKIKAIHAGLECGLFLESYPELDMISIGPTLQGVHSPSECLELATVPMVFEHLAPISQGLWDTSLCYTPSK